MVISSYFRCRTWEGLFTWQPGLFKNITHPYLRDGLCFGLSMHQAVWRVEIVAGSFLRISAQTIMKTRPAALSSAKMSPIRL